MKKLCIEWKRKCQIYGNVLRIRRVKINEDKRVENDLFCVKKLRIEWKRKCKIYGNVLRIRRVKINEDKRVENEWY